MTELRKGEKLSHSPRPASFLFVLLALSLLLVRCSSQQSASQQMSYVLGKEFLLQPDFRVYQSEEDTSELYFKVGTQRLLYTRQNKDDAFTARLKVNVDALFSVGDKIPFFQDSSLFTDRDNNQSAKELIGRMKVVHPPGRDFILRVSLTDINRNITETRLLRSLVSGEASERQGFMLFDARTEAPLVGKTVQEADTLLVKYRDSAVDMLYCHFLQSKSGIARPPFDAAEEPKEDFEVGARLDLPVRDGYARLPISRGRGLYFIHADSVSTTGCSLFQFEEGFPSISMASQLVGPIRYLSSNEEFAKITQSTNLKMAAEQFWIDRCGGKERAKEVIKSFYNRVENANSFFTSSKEGWKTDRGMIYIIFGAPDAVYAKENSETWVYGQDANVLSLNFSFSRRDNPFSENDFVLQRSQAYRNFWYTALEFWRSGQIFSL